MMYSVKYLRSLLSRAWGPEHRVVFGHGFEDDGDGCATCAKECVERMQVEDAETNMANA